MLVSNRPTAIAAGATEDIGFDPMSLNGEGLARHLETRVQDTLNEVLASDIWALLSHPNTDLAVARDVLKEVYLEIVMYQPDSIEAAMASIGQMPRSMPVAWVEEMLHHQVEEFDHGEMALRDYLGLAGSEEFARNRIQSPSAFAVASMWRNITHKRDPFLYLGAVYLFDALTPIITDIVMKLFASKSELASGLEFISHHATADVEHAAQIRALIVEVVDRFPEAKTSVAYGFEYFKHVYPLPVWDAARLRVTKRLQISKFVSTQFLTADAAMHG